MTDAPRSPLRIVLAEDSVLLREGLVRLFDEAGFETVAAYGEADSLLAGLDETLPDLAVLDVRMPPTFRDEGVRAAIELRRRMPKVGVLLLSQYVEGTYAHELLSSGEGGMGYLLKDRVASLDELEDAVERVSEGGTVLDPQVVRELLSRRSDPLDVVDSARARGHGAHGRGPHQRGHREAALHRRRRRGEERHLDLPEARPRGLGHRSPSRARRAHLAAAVAETTRARVNPPS